MLLFAVTVYQTIQAAKAAGITGLHAAAVLGAVDKIRRLLA